MQCCLIWHRRVQGEIEKTDEDLPLSVWESPPKKRRKKKTGAAPEEGVATGNPDMQQENEAEEPGAEQAKKKRKKMLSSSNDATKSGKKVLASSCVSQSRASLALLQSSVPPLSCGWVQLRQTTLRMMPPAAAAEPPATDAVPQPPSLAVQAAIAGVTFIDIPERTSAKSPDPGQNSETCKHHGLPLAVISGVCNDGCRVDGKRPPPSAAQQGSCQSRFRQRPSRCPSQRTNRYSSGAIELRYAAADSSSCS